MEFGIIIVIRCYRQQVKVVGVLKCRLCKYQNGTSFWVPFECRLSLDANAMILLMLDLKSISPGS